MMECAEHMDASSSCDVLAGDDWITNWDTMAEQHEPQSHAGLNSPLLSLKWLDNLDLDSRDWSAAQTPQSFQDAGGELQWPAAGTVGGQPVTLQANALCQQETGPAASWQLQALDMLPSVPSATFKALELPQIPAAKGDSLMTASDLPLEAELALGYTLHGSQDTGSGGLPGSQEVAAARSGSMHSSASTSSQGLPCPEQAQLRWPAIGGPGHAQAQKAANNRGSEGQLQYSRAGHGSQGLVQYRRAISGSQGLLQGNRAGSSGSEEPEEEEERVDPSLPAKERRKASNRLAQRKLQLKRKRERQAITEAHETLRMQLAAAVALSANLMTRNAALEKQHLIAAKHWSSDQAMTAKAQAGGEFNVFKNITLAQRPAVLSFALAEGADCDGLPVAELKQLHRARAAGIWKAFVNSLSMDLASLAAEEDAEVAALLEAKFFEFSKFIVGMLLEAPQLLHSLMEAPIEDTHTALCLPPGEKMYNAMLDCMKLTQEQQAEMVIRSTSFQAANQPVRTRRSELMAQLQSSSAAVERSGQIAGLNPEVADQAAQLQELLVEEKMLFIQFGGGLFGQVLGPRQCAESLVAAYPHALDMFALCDHLAVVQGEP
eukprot:jgi/Astpho2/7199/Aster-01517